MSTLPLIDDFQSIVIQNRPLIDLRAPIEFAKGSFPNTVNLPLLSDEERELIGTTYKQKGNEEAVALGYRLVSGDIKEQRVQAWLEFIKANPNSYLFCWRGGQRSAIVQEWLAQRGVIIPRLKGGYKAFRNYLIEQSISLAKEKEIYTIAGQTGSGKTLLINQIPQAIDLEGLAHHRGSAFGRYAHPQPTQIGFENALAYAQIRHNYKQYSNLVIEDESRNIGQRYIPPEVFSQFQKAKVVLLERSLRERVNIIYNDYIIYSQAEYAKAHSKGQIEHSWYEAMKHNFKKIQKRLGIERYRRLDQMLDLAWREQENKGNPQRHKEWIKALLKEYYDPMYNYQIEQKKDKIIFRGGAKEVLEFFSSMES